MKNEIDLRPREFIQAHNSAKRRLAAGILAVIIAAAVLLCFVLAERQIERLDRQVAALRQANQALVTRAAPLARLEAEIRALEEKTALETALREQAQPWSEYINQIEAALPQGFRLNALAADGQGKLTLNGNGPAMPGIATYSQALQQLTFIIDSAVSRIELDANGSYRFVIQAALDLEDSK